MALSAEQILEQLRALAPAERLRVVEQVVHEVAREVTPARPVVQQADAIWAGETDAELDAFQKVLQELRAADVWRGGDGQGSR
jgi:ABC-type uncharacterized transport system substrate-binding protein